MLSLLRRVSGDEAQDSGATSQAPLEKRLVPQLALDKLNAVTAKGGAGEPKAFLERKLLVPGWDTGLNESGI